MSAAPPSIRDAIVPAEEALLGSVLSGATAWADVAGLVSVDDFVRSDHRIICIGIQTLVTAGRSIDIITVAEHLQSIGRLDDAGGLQYLGTLARDTPTAAYACAYAEVLRDRRQYRELVATGERLIERAANPNGRSIADLQAAARADLERIADTDTLSGTRELPGKNFAELRPHLADSYMIKGLATKGSAVAIIGPPNCGKSFFAVDMAVHIASGTPWRGHAVAPGLVVYVVLEGAASVENRMCAARDKLNFGAGIPLRLTPGPINLCNALDVNMLIEFVRAAEVEHGVKAVAIFIDTLSRAMPGADENAAEGMGEAIAGADAVRLATGASVFLVHHTGKDESRGARGHSSLRGALDTEIEVSTTNNVHVATVTKQRDLPCGAHFAFRLEVVELGRDADNDPVTTCVVREADEPAAARRAPAGKHQAALLAALQEWQRAHPDSTHISSVEYRGIASSVRRQVARAAVGGT